jgi:hypothetical protein
MRATRFVGFVCCVVLLAAGVEASGSRWSLKLHNSSRFDIYELFMSSTETNQWGRDLLGSGVIRSGETWTVEKIMTGEYDIKFVDEDGDSCVLRNQRIIDNTTWNISTDWLLRCEFH